MQKGFPVTCFIYFQFILKENESQLNVQYVEVNQ